MSRPAGHALQLAGTGLVFLGLAVVVAALVVAGRYPTVPLGAFVAGALAAGAPLMIAGGRLNGRGRGLVLGRSPDEAAREYRDSTTLLAFYLLFLWTLGAIVAAPVFARATGLIHPTDTFTRVWITSWMLALCAARPWVTRPLWRAIERRVRARREVPTVVPWNGGS